MPHEQFFSYKNKHPDAKLCWNRLMKLKEKLAQQKKHIDELDKHM